MEPEDSIAEGPKRCFLSICYRNPDLWKLLRAEPREVRSVQNFRRIFEPLVLGRSLLERISDDGRARSKFFVGGNGEKVRLFEQWMPTLAGQHHRVRFDPLSAVVFWLADEPNEPPDMRELASEIFGIRSPSEAQIEQTQVVFDGFCLNLKDWSLWEYVVALFARTYDAFVYVDQSLKHDFCHATQSLC